MPPFVALICYEGLFPEITRQANLTDRAKWIVLISNDAWFGGGMGPAQHYAQNRYRAIETGLPLVRAANRGASGIVDGYGRETMRTLPAETAPEGWNRRRPPCSRPGSAPCCSGSASASSPYWPSSVGGAKPVFSDAPRANG